MADECPICGAREGEGFTSRDYCTGGMRYMLGDDDFCVSCGYIQDCNFTYTQLDEKKTEEEEGVNPCD